MSTNFNQCRQNQIQVAGSCGYREEISSSINAGKFLTSLLVSFSRTTLLHGVIVHKYIICLLINLSCFPSLYRVAEKSPYTQTIHTSDSI
jgi:hypothetical protein